MYKFDRSLDFVRSIKNVTIANGIAVDEDKFHDFLGKFCYILLYCISFTEFFD